MATIQEILRTKTPPAPNGLGGKAPQSPQLPLVARAEGLLIEYVDITPQLAKDWIERRNPNNRHLSKTRVGAMARDMKSGKWTVSHQGISFTQDGEVSDGHHRLHAIIESGCTIRMLVVYGVPHSAVIDRGRPRSETDARRMAGSTERSRTGATYLASVKAIPRIAVDNFALYLTSAEVEAVEAAHPDTMVWLVDSVHRKYPAAVWGALAFAHRTFREDVEFFARAIMGKESAQPGSASLTFATNFFKLDTAGSANMREIAVKTLSMLKHHMSGTRIIKLAGSEDAYQWFRSQMQSR